MPETPAPLREAAEALLDRRELIGRPLAERLVALADDDLPEPPESPEPPDPAE